jgi:hypothetical protein
MTDDQTRTIVLLRNELREKRRILEELLIDEYRGDVFTEVNGVTVKIGRAGGIDLPAVRSYLEPLGAAVNADIYFAQQRERDEANPKAATFKTGHFNPRFDLRTKRCSGKLKCPRCR